MSGRRPAAGRALKALVAAAAVLALAGCVRGCPSSRPPIHLNPNMDLQPKYKAQRESEFFYDGAAMRPLVPGTVARGELRDDTALYTGRDAAGNLLASSPLAVDDAVLARGERQYAIYCQPCHDARGTGTGILYERGKVPTPSFHEQRLLDAGDGYIFDVISNGIGLMQPYRWPVGAEDRWAVVAHVRRLQAEGPEGGPQVATAR